MRLLSMLSGRLCSCFPSFIFIICSILGATAIAQTEDEDVPNIGYESFMEARLKMPTGLDERELKVYLMREFYDVYIAYSDLREKDRRSAYDFYHRMEAPDIPSFERKLHELVAS